MKKMSHTLAAAFLLAAVSASVAQNVSPDLSEKWTLDLSKSDLRDRAKLESM